MVSVLCGVYPLQIDPRNGRLMYSRFNTFFTLMHLVLFTYSLIALLYHDAKELLLPLMFKSNVEKLCNIGLRTLNVMFSYIVLIKTYCINQSTIDDYNKYFLIHDYMTLLQIPNEKRIQRIHTYFFVMFVLLSIDFTFGVWFMINFFRMATGRYPHPHYTVLVVLAKCYQTHYTFQFIRQSYLQFIAIRDIRRHVQRFCAMSRDEHERNEHIFDRPQQNC